MSYAKTLGDMVVECQQGQAGITSSTESKAAVGTTSHQPGSSKLGVLSKSFRAFRAPLNVFGRWLDSIGQRLELDTKSHGVSTQKSLYLSLSAQTLNASPQRPPGPFEPLGPFEP